MAAADFVKGAMTGYQFVDGQYRQKEYDNQRRMAIQTEDERYQEGKMRQTRLDAESSNNMAFNQTQAIRANTIADENLALNRETTRVNQQRAIGQDAMAAQNQARMLQDRDIDMQDRDRRQQLEKKQELAQQAVFYAQRAMAGGSAFPKELHDQLVSEGMPYLSFYDGIERPQEHQAALGLAPILEAVGSGNVAAINSPQAIEAINQLYADEINEGVGEYNESRGATIVSKRIAELRPGPQPGKFGVVLEVTLDNGETYLAPRTRQSSSRPDDPVRLIDAGVALDDLVGRHQLAQMREQGKQSIADQYRAVYGALPGEQRATQPTLEKTTNPMTGQSEFFAWDGQNLNRVQPRDTSSDPFNGDPDDVVLQNLRQANPNTPETELLEYIRSARAPQS